jgi:hypothetical protein
MTTPSRLSRTIRSGSESISASLAVRETPREGELSRFDGMGLSSAS